MSHRTGSSRTPLGLTLLGCLLIAACGAKTSYKWKDPDLTRAMVDEGGLLVGAVVVAGAQADWITANERDAAQALVGKLESFGFGPEVEGLEALAAQSDLGGLQRAVGRYRARGTLAAEDLAPLSSASDGLRYVILARVEEEREQGTGADSVMLHPRGETTSRTVGRKRTIRAAFDVFDLRAQELVFTVTLEDDKANERSFLLEDADFDSGGEWRLEGKPLMENHAPEGPPTDEVLDGLFASFARRLSKALQ